MVSKSMEWDNWKTVYGDVKEDHHRAEWVNIKTGEVVKDTSSSSMYDAYIESLDISKYKYHHTTGIIHRNNIGDVFCSTDWSRH